MIITTIDAHLVVSCMDISHCIAEGAYTNIHYVNGSTLMVSKSLGVFFQELPSQYFTKVSRSAIVNICHVIKVVRGKNKVIKVKNGDCIDYTIQVNELLNRLKALVNNEGV